MKKTGERRKSRLRRAAAIAGTVAVITIAALIFLYRDQLTPAALRTRFGLSNSTATDVSAAYTFDSGGDQVFAAAGNCLAVASASGFQFLDSSGYLAAQALFSMQSPAVAAFPGGAAFYDLGGTALRVAYESGKTVTIEHWTAGNGETVSLDQAHTILAVSANKSGMLAVLTEAPGYKALLTVFNKNLDPVYAWYSGTLRVLSAQVSPKGDSVTALCLSDTGSTIQCLSLSKEDPAWSVSYPGELFLDLRYCGNEIALLSTGRLLFLNADSGAEAGSFDFAGRRLSCYDLGGDGFVAVVLGKAQAGIREELITISSTGTQRGDLILDRGADSVCASGQRVLLLSGGSVILYDAALKVKGERDDALGFQRALLLQSGDGLLLTSFTAERYQF
ncbi:MAG: hypothetical protein FWC62_00720 [Firmicutes bacterium]|nr:hypothetical protein [Bacillota bacterium]